MSNPDGLRAGVEREPLPSVKDQRHAWRRVGVPLEGHVRGLTPPLTSRGDMMSKADVMRSESTGGCS